MDCSPPGSSVHEILQARVLRWVAMHFSGGYSQPRDQTQVSHIGGRWFNLWATREALLHTKWSEVNSLSHVRLFSTPWTVAYQASPSKGFSLHGIFQARVLEWVAISVSRGSSWPRDWTWISHIPGKRLTSEPPKEISKSYQHIFQQKFCRPE